MQPRLRTVTSLTANRPLQVVQFIRHLHSMSLAVFSLLALPTAPSRIMMPMVEPSPVVQPQQLLAVHFRDVQRHRMAVEHILKVAQLQLETPSIYLVMRSHLLSIQGISMEVVGEYIFVHLQQFQTVRLQIVLHLTTAQFHTALSVVGVSGLMVR